MVFYDGGCPLCRREIAHYQRIVEDGKIQWIDIMDSGDALQAHGLTWRRAMRRIHVQDGDGCMVSGTAAFAALWRHIPRCRFLAGLVTLPDIHWIAEQAPARNS